MGDNRDKEILEYFKDIYTTTNQFDEMISQNV